MIAWRKNNEINNMNTRRLNERNGKDNNTFINQIRNNERQTQIRKQ